VVEQVTGAREEHDVSVEAAVEVIRRHLAELLAMEPGEIDPELPLSAYGLDSQSGVSLVVMLEEWSGTSIDAEIVMNRPSVADLAAAAVPPKH
jgi:acyl carrier protein